MPSESEASISLYNSPPQHVNTGTGRPKHCPDCNNCVQLPFALLSTEQLPDGYYFDKYQLIVPKDFASPGSGGGSGTGIPDIHTDDTSSSSSNTEEKMRAGDTDIITNASSDTSLDAPEGAPESIRPIANNATTKASRGKVAATLEDASKDEPDGQDSNPTITIGPSEDGCAASVDTVRRRNLRESAKINNQQAGTRATKRPSSLPKRGSRTDSNLEGLARQKDQVIPSSQAARYKRE
ncbi:uncharacterized protein BCR38DRAFT_413879 [Pseudomassariella vexata]|uniref:Uncharacterized protein n=1 Tax=Pseudomassariella vexata TaxID=1141098 RepID=A0A1Y2DDX5_9PEZI|nr:uncharacterized protein BCR38DRAFT_413879 [Pseudomassariella vexata]ORY57482.1 hypothetical protein BCR38DRAFT_413879 [Pseudomassariella vexata]